MSKIISEENPAAQPAGAQGADQKIKKQARQLAYDVRYKVKQGFKDGQKADPVSLKRAYISQLGRSPAPGPVKAAAKMMLVGESYDFVDVTDTVKSSISDVLNSVFTVGGGKKEEEVVEDAGVLKKFKVRVKDKKTGRSYVRMADRAKISELRKNPNIASVEMTSGGGTAYEGEKKKGEATASVKAGKGVPGDIEKVKEEFIGEVNVEDDNPSANPKKIDVMKGKNKITINPTQSEQVDAQAKKDDKDDQPAEPAKMDPKEKRVSMMKRMILQKKMQAVRSGAGMDIVAHTELEGEVISEKEVKVKDTEKVIDAIRAYDKSKDASRDATADSDEGKTGKAKKEKAYAKKERGEIDKDDPNWKKKKYHTGMHGEETELDPKHTDNTKNEATMENTNEAYTVTNADKKGNTPAWQGYKSGKKNAKTGKPLYTAAGHVKESYNRLGLKSWTNFVEDNDIDRPIKDQTDKQIADVTFDGGAAIPATIKGSGDAREIPTAIALIKNKYRAQGIMASKEPEGELVDEGLIGKAIQGVGKVVGGAENVATGTVKGVVKGTAGAAKKVAKTVGGAVSGGTRTAVRTEGVTATHKGTEYKLLPGKVRKKMKGKGGLDGDYRDEWGKAKDAVTDKLGLTNTKRDGVKCPKGQQDCGEGFSDWRTDLDLREITSDAKVVDGDSDEEPEITEKKVKNKIKINPTFKENAEELAQNLGGQLLEVAEVNDEDDDTDERRAEREKQKEQMMKKRIIRMKLRAVNSGDSDGIVAGYTPAVDAIKQLVNERLGGKGYKPRKDYAGRRVSGDWEDSDRGSGNKSTRRAGGTVKKKSPTYQAYVLNKAVDEGVTAKYKGKNYKLLPGKVRAKMSKKGGLDGDYRDGVGKVKDAITDKLGLTNTKRDGVKCPKGLLGNQDCNSSYEPEGKMVESVGSAVDKAIGAVGDTAKVAGKAAKGSVKVASKVAKGAADAAATVAGTPIGVAKSIKKGFQKGTQAESMTDYQKLQSTKDIIKNILTQESLGSAIDKGLGAVGDTAKVAGKAAKGSVKVASKVAKGTADAAATVAGTPIGVAKSVKKGWQKGTQAESVGSAVDKAVGAVGDTATVAGKAAKGSVKVGSKVAKGTGETIGRILGTPIGVAKSVKKGFQKGASAE